MDPFCSAEVPLVTAQVPAGDARCKTITPKQHMNDTYKYLLKACIIKGNLLLTLETEDTFLSVFNYFGHFFKQFVGCSNKSKRYATGINSLKYTRSVVNVWILARADVRFQVKDHLYISHITAGLV